MKCEEFRLLIKSQEDIDARLEGHLETCNECNQWLNREIEEPPQGLTSAEWQAATARCFPEKGLPVEPVQPESFWSFYLNGFKYGAVFGLSIVTGFAILSLRQEIVPQYDLKQREEISFIETEKNELPVFVEDKKFDVTFWDYQDSELVSFVENTEMPEFLEDSKEEETWKEQSS